MYSNLMLGLPRVGGAGKVAALVLFESEPSDEVDLDFGQSGDSLWTARMYVVLEWLRAIKGCQIPYSWATSS